MRDFFTAIVGTITYETNGGQQKATFQVEVDKTIIDVVYAGPAISEDAGQVSYLEFRREGVLWLTYGSLSGPILFDYVNGLSAFHAQVPEAARTIMKGNDKLLGSSHGDHLEGYAGNDWLNGSAGAETLDGGSGNDTYIVDNRDDRVFEAVGDGKTDVVYTSVSFALAADDEIEELRAAAGVSLLSLIGSEFSNLIVGTSGNDEIDGKSGVDTLNGGAGDDHYIVDSPFDVIWEDIGQGRDTVVTRASFTLSANIEALKAAGGYSSVKLTGNTLSNEIVGNRGANEIRGVDGNDELYGDGGNDVLRGSAGYDYLYGGIGNDTLSGGDGNDRVCGDTGIDKIDGGAGHDQLYGGTGNNRVMGQSGNDTLYGGMHADILQGGDGNDRLYGDVDNDSLDGGAGKDTLSGGGTRQIHLQK